MSTNEKTANEIIGRLEAEKTELLKTLESANDLIEADSKMHAKYMEKSIELIKLAKENERLRDLLCAWWRNANDQSYYMDKDTIANTIAIVAEKNRKGNEK